MPHSRCIVLLTGGARGTGPKTNEDSCNYEHSDVLAGGLQDGREDSERCSQQHSILSTNCICHNSIEKASNGSSKPDCRSIKGEGCSSKTEIIRIRGKYIKTIPTPPLARIKFSS